jgi:hypothetical protein
VVTLIAMIVDHDCVGCWRAANDNAVKCVGLVLGMLSVDCSKGALAWSLGQNDVLSFNGYWGKRSEYSLAKPEEAT